MLVAETEHLRDKIPAIVAAAAATVTAAILGSFLGTAGTLAGMALASLVSGTLTHLFQQGILRSRSTARARLERYKKSHLQGVISQGEYERLYRPREQPRPFRWKTAALLSAVVLVVSLGVVTTVEFLARKPLSDVVQGRRGSGLSVTGGGSQQQPQLPATPSPSYVPTPSVEPSASISATETPSSSPSPSASSSSSPGPSPGPGATVSPSPTATGTPAPGPGQ